MTVKELIEELQKIKDPTRTVCLIDRDGLECALMFYNPLTVDDNVRNYVWESTENFEEFLGENEIDSDEFHNQVFMSMQRM